MSIFTIEESFQTLEPGNYTATFQGLTSVKTKTKTGDALRWEFKTDDGKTISGLSDAEKPTPKNKLGKWLCALGRQPLAKGTQVEPEKHIGKKYLVIVNAERKIEMFTML